MGKKDTQIITLYFESRQNSWDLAESDNITAEHISEAINFRNLDREGWAG
jgi:hypothetical protein